jgi:hypothetical protein
VKRPTMSQPVIPMEHIYDPFGYPLPKKVRKVRRRKIRRKFDSNVIVEVGEE